ncbi:MAG TPA: hypothetical protein VGL08_04505 [Paraburkholderia sp.]|jgi:hypothetical protein
MKLPSFAIMLALLMAGSSTAVAASRDEQTKACKADAMRLCSAEIPNKDKIEACMKEHIDQLSPPCKKMFQPSAADSQ